MHKKCIKNVYVWNKENRKIKKNLIVSYGISAIKGWINLNI